MSRNIYFVVVRKETYSRPPPPSSQHTGSCARGLSTSPMIQLSFSFPSFPLCVSLREAPLKGWVAMVTCPLVPWKHHDYSQQTALARAGSSRVVPGPASPTSPGSLSEMQIPRFRPRATESETTGMAHLSVF